jgi:hypothetical protein
MRCVSITLAVLAFVAGMSAAYDWYRSTRVREPAYPSFEPVEVEGKVGMLSGLQAQQSMNNREIARLNRRAAVWTTAAAILSALSSIAGNLN